MQRLEVQSMLLSRPHPARAAQPLLLTLRSQHRGALQAQAHLLLLQYRG